MSEDRRIAFSSTEDPPDPWREVLEALTPPLDLRVWPGETGNGRGIEAALVWRPPPEMWKDLPDLKLIQSLGAGIDHVLLSDAPGHLPLARHVDPDLTRQMVEYGVLAVLACHRGLPGHIDRQRRKIWGVPDIAPTEQQVVGVLGAGVIGTALLERLVLFDFRLRAWTRSPRKEAISNGVKYFHGKEGLQPFLSNCGIVISLLPGTLETKGLINAARLATLPRGAHVINLGRGSVIPEDNLVAALESGQVASCFLDVFPVEPLPKESPLWSHPGVIVTPHAAGVTRATPHAAKLLAGNLTRVRRGEPPLHGVEPSQGY